MTTHRSNIFSWPGVLVACVALAGCGGGGGGSSEPAATPATPTSPATTTSVVSKGVITGFGSVYVNGERYELDDSTRVNVDDEDERTGDDSALRLGMKVDVDAERRDGRLIASSIVHRRDLKGPVTDVVVDVDDPALGTFRLARTLVVVDGETLFDSNIGDNDGNGSIDIRDLVVSSGRMVVAVSGFVGDDGYLATRITRKSGVDDDDEIEIKGFIDAVDTAGSSFVVSGTTFLVTTATRFEDGLVFGEGLLGRFVEVEGRITASGYEAIEVEPEDDEDDRRGEFEIEGILVSVDTTVTPNQVQIGSRTLNVTDASGLTGLVGAKVEIEGRFNADGVLVIEQIRAKGGSVKLEDTVTSIDAAAGLFTTRLGLEIRPEPTSRLENDDDDDRLTPAQFLNLLRSGERIEARGFQDAAGAVVWTRIEREDDDDLECELQARVDAIAADETSFDLLGVTIDVAPGRDVEFEDEDDEALSRAQFFARLVIGDVVKAESGDDDPNGCQNGLLLAEEVEFERDASAPVLPATSSD